MKLRRTIAVLLVIIFALVSLPALFLRSITATYLNMDFYNGKILDRSYEYATSFISSELLKEDDVKTYFTKEDIDAMIKKYIPEDLMQELVGDFKAQLKGINDGRKNDAIVVSLMPIKNNMGSIAENIAIKVVENIQPCTVAEDEEFELKYVEGKPVCIPDSFNTDEITQGVKHEIEKELNNIIPGEFTLELALETEGQVSVKQILSFVDYLQIILPLIMLVVLLFIALFIYSPYSLISKFTGASLALAGVFGLGGAQIIRQVPSLTITSVNFPDMLAEEISSLQEIYNFLLGFVVDRMSVYSLYLLGIGIVVFLFGFYLSHFHEHIKKY